MSTDHSPEWAYSPNVSILKRVTSRVSQWFSPTTTSPDGQSPTASSGDQQQLETTEAAVSRDLNGHLLRRRCSDMISPRDPEDMTTQPPLKRTKTTTVVEERHTRTTTLTSSTPTTSSLTGRRRLRSGFVGTSSAKPFDFSSLATTSIKPRSEMTTFNADLVRNYKGVLGRGSTSGGGGGNQEESTRQVVLGFEEDDDEMEGERRDNEEEEEEEDVNPDDEVQIVIKPAKSYLNDTEEAQDEEEEEEENDVLTELNVRRKEQQRQGKSRINGSDKVDTSVAGGSGNAELSGSEGSQDSSMNTSLLSKRRKLGLSRMTPTSKNNGTGASTSANAASSSINFAAHLQSAKSLFSDKNILASSSLNASTTSLNSLAPKRSFNAGLYGSMSALSDSRLLNIKSPYYNGPTMFGGASGLSQKPMLLSASSRAGANKLFRSNTGLPMMMRPSSSLSSLSMLGHQRSPSRGGTEANATAGGSPKGTARRVLDLINQLNSPLEEIRKMASGSLLNESSSSSLSSQQQQQRLPSLVGQRSRFAAEKSGIRMNSPKTPYSRGNAAEKQRSPLTTELQVPSMPQLLQMNKLQRSTEEIRRLAFQSRSTLNQETEYRLPGGGAATESVSKMKVKLNRMAARGGQQEKDSGGGAEGGAAAAATSIEVPKFPEIKFPEMKAMPQIDIQLPPKEQTRSNSNNSSQVNNNLTNTSKSSSMAFGAVEAAPKNAPTSSATPPSVVVVAAAARGDFQFAAPIALKTSTPEARDGSPAKMNFIFRAPSEASEGEKSSSSSSSPTTAKPMFGTFKFNPETAKVKEGFTATASPVAATEVKKPLELKKGSVEEALGLSPKPLSFGDQFKAPANTWTCSVCMVRNKETDLKCLACTTPKEMPTTKPAAVVPAVVSAKPADDGFKALIAAQKADKWECSECMTRNDSTAVKCLCCESPKPGSGGAAAAKKLEQQPAKINSSNPFATGAQNFSFGFKKTTTAESSDEGFGKLVSAQQAKWECSTCMTRNEQKSSKCACCDQAKPGAQAEKLPQFSFGAVSNSNKFSFGVPQTTTPSKEGEEKKTEASPVTKGFSFGSSKPVVGIEAKEAPKFAFGMPPAAKVEEPKAKVESPAEKKVEEEKKTTATAAAAPILGGFKFGVPSQAAAVDSKPAAVAEKITPIGGFKFGMSATTSTPGGFAFGAPAAKTISTSSTSFTTIEVKKSETATGEAGKPEAEAEKKATAAATTTTTSFAFGSSPSTSVPIFGSAAEAPKKIESISSPVFGGVAFGAKDSPAKEQSNNSTFNSPFAFGGNSATATTTTSGSPAPVFGSPSGGVVATNNSLSAIKPIAFGTSPAATAGLAKPVVGISEAPKATFAFGSAVANKEPAKTFGGSPSSSPFTIGAGGQSKESPSNSPFGAASSANFGSSTASAAAPSLFGGSARGVPAFGASAPVPAFGSGMAGSSPFGAAKPAEATPSLFGSASSVAMSPFGASSGAGGGQSTGIFGGITATPNSIPAFGSPAPVVTANTTNSFDVKDSPTPFQFGSSTATGGVTSGSSNNNNRSFVFGAQSQQQQQQQQPAQEANKPFNFSAGMTPNFNFGGAGNAVEPQQSNHPFTFGGAAPVASSIGGPAPGAFNFMASSAAETGSISTPGFQFSATTNNPFYPMAQPSKNTGAQQGRRILKARRTQPR